MTERPPTANPTGLFAWFGMLMMAGMGPPQTAPIRRNGMRIGPIRNKPCPCGSGNKAKRCCARDATRTDVLNVTAIGKRVTRVRLEAGSCVSFERYFSAPRARAAA